jgi:hypothetical protein
MKPLIDPDMVVIAEIDNEVAGMLVCLPNLMEAVRDLDGSLLPFGFAKLLWRLKRKTLKTARVPLMGIRRKYHGTLTGAALLPLMFHRLKGPFFARGLEQVELGWISKTTCRCAGCSKASAPRSTRRTASTRRRSRECADPGRQPRPG